MISSKPKSYSYSSTQSNQVQGDQVKQIGVKPEVEAEAKEANSSRTKVLVAKATRIEGITTSSVTTVTRRATLLKTVLTTRMMMTIRSQVGQERLHQPRRLRKKKKKKSGPAATATAKQKNLDQFYFSGLPSNCYNQPETLSFWGIEPNNSKKTTQG